MNIGARAGVTRSYSGTGVTTVTGVTGVQRSLGFRRKSVPSKVSVAQDHDRRNLEAARFILDQPEQFGGVEAFPAVWARLVVGRLRA